MSRDEKSQIRRRFFFFSSRRRHTRLQGDWSSDVCSSDLSGDTRRPTSRIPLRKERGMALANAFAPEHPYSSHKILLEVPVGGSSIYTTGMRSEERRVGKECRSRWSPYH